MAEKPHYHGHRQRPRARFDEAGGDALPDYELLELGASAVILVHNHPSGDPTARRAPTSSSPRRSRRPAPASA